MGIIKRQAYSGTILSYLGVLIGFITTALIFPEYLTTAEIGLLSIFLSYAYIFAQLATLGTGRITIAVFPFFRDRKNHHHGFFPLMIILGMAGLILAFIAIYIMKRWLISNSNDTSPLFGQYYNYLFPLLFFTFLFMMLDSFNTTLFNAIRGIYLKELLQRLLIMAAVTFYALKWVGFDSFVMLFVLAVGIPAFILLFYVMKNDEFCLKPAFSPLVREKSRLMAYIGVNGILIGFSGMVILNIDRIMVERMMGLGSTGIYTTMAYFATLVAIPSRALLKISDPVIAQAWKDNDITSLQDNYYRSSLNQFLIGSLLMVGIWGNIDNVLRILPAEFAEGKLVVLFVSLAFLTDMLTGTATFILANSKYFKYQTLYIMILVILIIITNLLLIPVWGLTGAAVATLISKILSNFIRHQILLKKFGLQPYNAKFLVIALVAGLAYLSQYFIPFTGNLYLDLVVRSGVMSLVFVILVLSLKISPEVNERYKWFLGMVRKILS
ncbi:MAG: polysaccharide biosynthesis C-terminal domain-containing protein [Bacteroidales bacterium]|nr:polysaccharide biosynthesis C-terminal domain-containing protein [Bacteroidales bacterium]